MKISTEPWCYNTDGRKPEILEEQLASITTLSSTKFRFSLMGLGQSHSEERPTTICLINGTGFLVTKINLYCILKFSYYVAGNMEVTVS
jgi:hypothetical protein